MSEPRLSLFQIETELLGLIEARAAAQDRIDAMSPDELTASPEIGEEIATIEGLIREYVAREVRKVDNIARVIREYETRARVHKEESARLKALADQETATAERIESMALSVMQELGTKSETGRFFRLTRQGNGGMRALTISQPNLVPLRLRRVEVEFSADQWRLLGPKLIAQHVAFVEGDEEPNLGLIRQELERGEGVPGCRLEDRGEHLRIK